MFGIFGILDWDPRIRGLFLTPYEAPYYPIIFSCSYEVIDTIAHQREGSVTLKVLATVGRKLLVSPFLVPKKKGIDE